jgi:myo-inositol 2-dehydrogenase/D-chiro-inositol 1-dehydrogenase
MRAVVVGAGRIGSFHARNLAKSDAVDEIVVVDPGDAAARALAGSLRDTLGVDVDVSSDLAAVLAPGVDLVVVGAPTALHASLIRQCVDAGVPVFCEKPGATSLEEAAQLRDAVAASGVSVQIGFQRRFDPPIRAAATARERGDVGHTYLVRSATHDHEPPDITYVAPRETLFTETLIHDFDAIRYVTGQEVTRVMAMSHAPGPDELGFDADVRHAAVLMQLDGGAQAVATAAWHDPCGYDVRLELLGSRDSIAVGYGERPQLRRLDVSGDDDPVPRRYGGFLERFEVAYRDELEAFVDCVRAGTPPQVGVGDAYAALAIAHAAWDSFQQGVPVELGASQVVA